MTPICESPWPAVIRCGNLSAHRIGHLYLCADCWEHYRAVILPAPGALLQRDNLDNRPGKRKLQKRRVVAVHLHRDGSPGMVEYRTPGAGKVRRVPWDNENIRDMTPSWMDWALHAEVVP